MIIVPPVAVSVGQTLTHLQYAYLKCHLGPLREHEKSPHLLSNHPLDITPYFIFVSTTPIRHILDDCPVGRWGPGGGANLRPYSFCIHVKGMAIRWGGILCDLGWSTTAAATHCAAVLTLTVPSDATEQSTCAAANITICRQDAAKRNRVKAIFSCQVDQKDGNSARWEGSQCYIASRRIRQVVPAGTGCVGMFSSPGKTRSIPLTWMVACTRSGHYPQRTTGLLLLQPTQQTSDLSASSLDPKRRRPLKSCLGVCVCIFCISIACAYR